MVVSLRLPAAFLAVLLASFASSAWGQKQSVNPGINKSFQNPQVNEFVERFEREGREVYDKKAEIVEATGVKPGMAVADVGAGTGLFSRLFAARVGKEGRVYAVDIAQNFVDHVEESCRQENLNNVVGVVCKPDDVALPPNSVDLVFICDTYHHFEFPEKTMRSIQSALRPGGELVLIDFKRIEGESSDWILNHVRAGQETFTKEVLDAGFRQVEEKSLLKDNYFVRFKKVDPSGNGKSATSP